METVVAEYFANAPNKLYFYILNITICCAFNSEPCIIKALNVDFSNNRKLMHIHGTFITRFALKTTQLRNETWLFGPEKCG